MTLCTTMYKPGDLVWVKIKSFCADNQEPVLGLVLEEYKGKLTSQPSLVYRILYENITYLCFEHNLKSFKEGIMYGI